MKLPLMTSIHTFWNESVSYIITYGLYALIVCAIILFVENRLLHSDLVLNKLIYSNVSVLLLAIVLLILSAFVSGWMSHLFGGEIITFLVTVLISLALIYALKLFFINYYELPFESPLKVSMLTSLFLFIPYILFNVFVFILGSGFKN